MDIVDRTPDFNAQILADRTDHISHVGNMVSLTHCEICGSPIPEDRRVFVPGVRMCIECQQEFDSP